MLSGPKSDNGKSSERSALSSSLVVATIRRVSTLSRMAWRLVRSKLPLTPGPRATRRAWVCALASPGKGTIRSGGGSGDPQSYSNAVYQTTCAGDQKYPGTQAHPIP